MSMATLRLKRKTIEFDELSGHLDQRSRLYERNLRIKNMLRMQELMDEASFRRWKKLRFGGENPPADFDDLSQPMDMDKESDRP